MPCGLFLKGTTQSEESVVADLQKECSIKVALSVPYCPVRPGQVLMSFPTRALTSPNRMCLSVFGTDLRSLESSSQEDILGIIGICQSKGIFADDSGMTLVTEGRPD